MFLKQRLLGLDLERLKNTSKKEEEVRKEPLKRDRFRHIFYDVTHDTFQRYFYFITCSNNVYIFLKLHNKWTFLSIRQINRTIEKVLL